MYGTLRTIHELGLRAPTRAEDPASMAVITQFREEAHRELAVSAAASLRDVISRTLTPIAQEDDDRTVDRDLTLEPIFSVFQDRLLALPASWEAVVELVRRLHLAGTLAPLVDALVPPEEPDVAEEGGAREPIHVMKEIDGLACRRGVLSEFAARPAYAETADDTDFLPTESLRSMLVSHRTEPPLCVVMGAKGSGKTFTQLQMCFRRTWRDYARDVGVENVTLDALLTPVLVSKNLSDATRERIGGIQ